MFRKLEKIYSTLFSLAFLFVAPAFAQDEPPRLDGQVLQNIVDSVVYKYIFAIGGLICFGFIIQGGYMWIMSAGDPEKVKQAQGTIQWSVIGLIIVILARLLIGLVLDFIA